MSDEGYLGENEDELKELAQAVGESDAGKVAGGAAALATKVLTGSSIAAGGKRRRDQPLHFRFSGASHATISVVTSPLRACRVAT